jgi:hypothetical protein
LWTTGFSPVQIALEVEQFNPHHPIAFNWMNSWQQKRNERLKLNRRKISLQRISSCFVKLCYMLRFEGWDMHILNISSMT